MKFPNLVLDKFCNTEISGKIYGEGLTEEGAPIEYPFYDIKGNYQSSSKTILTDYQKIVEITGIIYIPGDAFPDLDEITSGEVEVMGIKRNIERGSKGRNPDGTVNFTKLELR